MEFWFTVGSTYTYLSVMRLEEVERETGVTFIWRPFALRQILQELKHVPFSDKPPKLAYMWRDLERRAKRYGLPYAGPAPYPLTNNQRLNKIAILALSEGWGKAFVRAVYREWFLARRDIGLDPALIEVLHRLERDPREVFEAADSTSALDALDSQTRRARDLGIFGAPTFVVGNELFWGDDRLDDAIDWQRRQP